ncbi:MAG: Maf family nucleotide pyrophosphatase [Chitinophagales bacterium]|nr:Maf family nucleotide pyrophosphatase [Chitinophagales bacterium]
MTEPKIVLASKSPRRHELLRNMGIEFTLMVPDVEETYADDLPVRMVPAFLSSKKANAVVEYIRQDQLIIAADTVVLLNDRIYGKPANEAEAIEMLQMLSGNMHEVITGVTIKSKEKEITFAELTRVYFRRLSNEMILHYVTKYHPYDKAGAYGIQEWFGYVAIEKVNGCFFNVMGLPTSRLVKELIPFGIDVTAS